MPYFYCPLQSLPAWAAEPSQGRHKVVKRPPVSSVGRNRARCGHDREFQWEQNSTIWDISANGDFLSLEQSLYLWTRQLLGPPSPADGLQDTLMSPGTSHPCGAPGASIPWHP